jgi:hypothetical protein
MENVILVGSHFSIDISSLDLMQVINPKEWATLSSTPVFNSIDNEIIDWLKQYAPTTYQIACATSGRKAHDQILINAIKSKILFEQLEYVGLRSLQHTRLFNLFSPIFENTYKYVVKANKKHDVQNEYVEFQSISNRYNISPDDLTNRYGFSDYTERKINALLEKQPESEYLQLCKNICDEAKLLDGLRRSIEVINFEPKDRSDYQTCACCFRWVRLKPNDRSCIAYHGYTIDRFSFNDVVNSSCIGADYAPFQISADGTIVLLKSVRNQITSAKNGLTSLDQGSKEREVLKSITNLQNKIKNLESTLEYAISRIEVTHPDRLEEAKSI